MTTEEREETRRRYREGEDLLRLDDPTWDPQTNGDAEARNAVLGIEE